MKTQTRLLTFCGAALLSLPFASAEDAAGDDLAKQLANPVSSLISVPFQANWDFGIGVNDASKFTLNIQPVVPLSLSEDWNLIIRTILPVVDAESPAPGIPDASGLGDIVQSFFFSPVDPVNGWIVGAGPAFLYPSATDDLLGLEKWGVGPTAVVLKQDGPWTYGALANHLWSFAGEDGRDDVNATFLQPFVSYITPAKTTYTLNSETTYDWDHDQWLVPFNAIVSQLFTIGSQPVQASLGARYYVEGPDGGPEWGVRAAITLLFPK
ncbi:MAG: transporter [Verrucomicrobiae bacterium]|nr:transporter [Verrucomicrobiae bacterium]